MSATDTTTDLRRLSPRVAVGLAALLLFVELGVIGVIFKHGIAFTCLDHWPLAACKSASTALLSVYCMFGATLLFAMLRPRALTDLFAEAGRLSPLWLNALGVGVTLVPLAFLQTGAGREVILPSFAFWTLGMLLLTVGLGLFLAPVSRWRSFVASYGLTLLPVLGAAAAAPLLAMQLRPLWKLDTIADLTFQGVVVTMRLLGYAPETVEGKKIIGEGDFFVNVAPACSGVEGIALVTLFVSIYLWLFRRDLRFPRALLLYPLGIALSATFNVIRIALLLAIGIEGQSELAVGGFHSHAGWLMFTIIALGIVALAQTVPALHRETAPVAAAERMPGFFEDPVVARILPFAVFMLSALLAQAFSTNPAVVYPLRVVAMAAALGVFWPHISRLVWRLDPVALGLGLTVGAMWVLIPVAPAEGAPPYGALTGAMLVGWFVMRGLGTIVLVPIIEELFFRGYLEQRLRFGTGQLWSVVAAVATAALFAALHDRIAEAFLAGLVFSYVRARSDRLADAIACHAVANALVFGVAIATGNLAII